MEQTPAARFIDVLNRLGYKTQQQIADLLQIARPTAGTIVRQEREPSFADVGRLKAEHEEVNIDWIFTGKGQALTSLKPASVTQSNVSAEPASRADMPPTVKRKYHRPLMSADPDLSHLSPEQQAIYWKRRHDQLLADQAQSYENEVHQETLRLINFPSASLEAASLFATVDALAFHYPLVAPEALEGVRSLSRFKPAARVIAMRPVVTGFQQQAAMGS